MQKSEKIKLSDAFRTNLRAFSLFHKHCPGMFLSITLHSIFSSVFTYIPIWFSAQIINELAGQRRGNVLANWVILSLLVIAAANLITAALERWKNARSYAQYYRFVGILAEKMHTMDYAEVDKQTTRDLYNQIIQNDNWTGWGLRRVVSSWAPLLQSISGIISAVALTFSLFTLQVPDIAGGLTVLNHPLSVIFVLGLLLASVIVSPMLSNKANSFWTSQAEDATLANRLFTYFAGYSYKKETALDIRINAQQLLYNHYLAGSSPFAKRSKIVGFAYGPMGFLNAASACLSALMVGLIYLFVCLKAFAGAFGIGSVTQYIGALLKLTENVHSFLRTVGELRVNTTFLNKTFEFLDIPNSMYQGSLTTEKRSDRQYEVEFKDVSFKYPGSDIWALRHVNMKFKVGKRLAIVGENGSGKTTFIKLLCRLYDPQEGQILLNGIDIRKYRYDDYMNIFSVVFQDFQLICQPLGSNVAGSMEYDRDQVRKALIDAGFGDRLATMEKGLDTMLYKDLSEDGVDVSGGEAQKIAIARALYKDAPFIILDEPTAALDPIAEAEIYSKFNDIAGDKTAIYISHRLSSCKFCDEIAVFHEGAVIQQGTHAELVADEGGKYHALWHAQAQYYTENNK